MKPIYRNILIALLILGAFAGGYYAGYIMAYYPATIRSRNEKHELIKRIRDLEAREKSRTSSDTNTGKPPKNE